MILAALFHAQAQSADLHRKLQHLLDFSVDTVTVVRLQQWLQGTPGVYILDTRARQEHSVSHIPGARWVGYREFNAHDVSDIPYDALVVTHCSVGYRSEAIGGQLREMGYTRVYNLYGGIFEWVNRGLPVLDSSGDTTQRVHTYSRKWSRYLERGEKVY